MIKIITRLTFSTCVLLISGACNQKGKAPESLADVNMVVAQLDSAVNAMYGWEPSDSTYNKSIDTLTLGILKNYDPEKYAGEDAGIPVIQQGAFDEARETWATFKSLCEKENYEQALDFYLAEKDGGEGTNAGDFLIYLKHSTCRYTFFSEVLLPLMREFKGEIYAFDEYINILQFEKAMEELSMALHPGDVSYFPEVYPAVIKDLGFALAASGRFDEAFALSSDLADALYEMTGNALFADFFGTRYGVQLYVQQGDKESALETWNDFKNHMEKHKDDFNAEDIEKCLQQVETEMERLN